MNDQDPSPVSAATSEHDVKIVGDDGVHPYPTFHIKCSTCGFTSDVRCRNCADDIIEEHRESA